MVIHTCITVIIALVMYFTGVLRNSLTNRETYYDTLFKLINSIDTSLIDDVTTLRHLLHITQLVKEKNLFEIYDSDIEFLINLSTKQHPNSRYISEIFTYKNLNYGRKTE